MSIHCNCTTKPIAGTRSAESSKHEACFKNAARLVSIGPGVAKNQARRGVNRVNDGEVTSHEKSARDIGGGDSESERAAARTIQEVDGAGIQDITTRLKVFRTGGQ